MSASPAKNKISRQTNALKKEKCPISRKGFFHPQNRSILVLQFCFVFLSYQFWAFFTEMRIYFRRDFAKCMCYKCYYEINVLKWNDLKIYQEKGLTIENKTLITPALVSKVIEIYHELFKYHYKMAPQTLKELSAREIYMNGTLNTDLLPYELKQYCSNILDSDLPVWYPEWTVPSVLIRHLDFTICKKL